MKHDQLTILLKDGVSFTELSYALYDYLRDSKTVLITNTKKIYIGFYKPINSFYVHFKTPSTIENVLFLKYWNKKTQLFEPVTSLFDETNGFRRNGFVYWGRNLEDFEKSTINMKELYWYELSFSESLSETEIMGLNLIFSSDHDLIQEVPEVSKYLPEGETTFINFHVAARNEIVQRLRNSGYSKKIEGPTVSNGRVYDGYYYENLTQWDLLEVGEIRQAAKFLTLEKIFNSISDKPDDFYATKGKYFSNAFESAFKLYYLSIDEDDDGSASQVEKLGTTTKYMTR